MDSKGYILLIDGDMLSYSLSYLVTASDEIPGIVTNAMEYFLGPSEYTSYIIALSCHRMDGFRRGLSPLYKAYRDTIMPNVTAEEIRHYMTKNLKVMVESRLEADDILSILATGAYKNNGIIISGDKDFYSTPCRLLNLFSKRGEGTKPIINVSEDVAFRNHMFQTVTGDSGDGVKGALYRGKKSAEILSTKATKKDIWHAVVGLYEGERRGVKQTEEDAILNARLTYLLRDGDYDSTSKKIKLWHPNHKIFNINSKVEEI